MSGVWDQEKLKSLGLINSSGYCVDDWGDAGEGEPGRSVKP